MGAVTMIDAANAAAVLFHLMLGSTICLLALVGAMRALQQGVFQAARRRRPVTGGAANPPPTTALKHPRLASRLREAVPPERQDRRLERDKDRKRRLCSPLARIHAVADDRASLGRRVDERIATRKMASQAQLALARSTLSRQNRQPKSRERRIRGRARSRPPASGAPQA
jgi:hypothetical protein